MRTNSHKGFTLIELLVVVAIIGLLLSIISVALTAQRVKARDARRLSDLKQIKSGLDLYYDNGGGYPDTASWVVGASLACSGTSIMLIPKDPSDPVFQYSYEGSGGTLTGCGTNVRRGYKFTFYIEKTSKTYYMNEEGTVRDSGSDAVVSLDSLL